MLKIEGTITFNNGIPISSELLGQEIGIIVNEVKGKLCFPQINIDPKNYDDEHVRLRDTIKKPSSFRINTTHEDDLEWGYVSEYPTGNAIIKALQLIFFIPEVKNPIEIGNRIKSELDKSIPRTLELIEIIKRIIYLKDDESSFFSFRLVYRNEKNEIRSASNTSNPLTATLYRSESYINKNELIFCLTNSSVDNEIKTEYKLQNAARRSFLQGDFRKTIFESALAVEIGFTDLILQELDKMGKKRFTKKLLNKFRTLGGRYELIKILEIPIPKYNYQRDLIDPRNDTVHRGIIPKRETAQKILKITDEILYSGEWGIFK